VALAGRRKTDPMKKTSVDAVGGTFEPLFQIGMDIDVFTSNWAYCDRLSSYAARMVSHNRIDSLLYSNLFSSALNELLETVFRTHGSGGSFMCSISRLANKDRIELTIPCKAREAQFYVDAMERLSRTDVAEQYRSALFAEGALDPDIGLFELVVDYEASISVETTEENTIRLIADLALEDTQA
jgi:hypothetical protein